MKKLIALIALIIIAYASTAGQALAYGTNSVSGIVFYDQNGDGIQSPDENAVPNAVVNVQEVGSDLIESLIANEFGYFNTGEMAFGEYEVWTEVSGRVSTRTAIQISEINGTALVDIGVTPLFTVMLPFVTN